jgi:uncharacterized RDD family membrane protein YckC
VTVHHGVDAGLEGHYAGIVTRLVAFVIDVAIIALVFAIGGHILEYLLSVVLHRTVRFSDAALYPDIILALWAFLYFAYPLAVSGRTCGMGVVGVRVVQANGRDLSARRAIVRTLALPLSFLLLCFGFLLIVLRGDRRALHDLIAGSSVVYAWDARAARMRFLTRH